jgi:hypothetical protein
MPNSLSLNILTISKWWRQKRFGASMVAVATGCKAPGLKQPIKLKGVGALVGQNGQTRLDAIPIDYHPVDQPEQLCIYDAHAHPSNSNPKGPIMILSRAAVLVLLCLPLGCAALSEKGKMEEFGRAMDSYDTAMVVSDFNSVCKQVDPIVMGRKECRQRYENVKIVSYDVLAVNVADDKRQVNQAVEIQFFFLDRYVLKKMQFDQSWHYDESLKRWLLKTEPPQFK